MSRKSFIGKYFPTKCHCDIFLGTKVVGGYMRGVQRRSKYEAFKVF
jgi:hypothetical protein